MEIAEIKSLLERFDISKEWAVLPWEIGPAEIKQLFAQEPEYVKLLPIKLWAKLLFNFSELAELFDPWDEFTPKHWAKILASRGDINAGLFKYCNKVEELGCEEWASIIAHNPSLMEHCNKWEEFTVEQWGLIACGIPDTALWEKYDNAQAIIEALPEENWCALIINQPQMAKYCVFLDTYSRTTWVKILRHHPELADKCLKLKDFSADSWSVILRDQPQMALQYNFDRWDEICSSYWVLLLERQPQLVKYCNCLDEFTDEEWDRLFRRNPQLANACPSQKLQQLCSSYPSVRRNIRRLVP